MPYNRRDLHMSRAQIKSLQSQQDKARKKREHEEEEQKMQLQIEQEQKAAKGPDPVVMEGYKKGGGHHCRSKDGKTCHVMSQICFRKKHVGICPECHHAVSSKYGCKEHKWKREDLQYENIIFPEGFD